MAENTLISPFLGTFMTAIFIFSTAYTLAFLYYQGVDANRNIANEAGLPASATADNAADPTDTAVSSGGVFGFLIHVADGVLEFLSWISPFAIVKLLFFWMMKGTPEIYLAINLLILRPVSWITSVFTINYILSRIPTEHGEI